MMSEIQRRGQGGPRGVAALTAAWGAAAMLLASGCETQPPYADCELDDEVTKQGVCDGTGGGKASCVVTKHPHCTSGICLSYFGTSSVCTDQCQADSDCAEGGFCWTFADKERYCVPADRKK